jgi:hypothetical protein
MKTYKYNKLIDIKTVGNAAPPPGSEAASCRKSIIVRHNVILLPEPFRRL